MAAEHRVDDPSIKLLASKQTRAESPWVIGLFTSTLALIVITMLFSATPSAIGSVELSALTTTNLQPAIGIARPGRSTSSGNQLHLVAAAQASWDAQPASSIQGQITGVVPQPTTWSGWNFLAGFSALVCCPLLRMVMIS